MSYPGLNTHTLTHSLTHTHTHTHTHTLSLLAVLMLFRWGEFGAGVPGQTGKQVGSILRHINQRTKPVVVEFILRLQLRDSAERIRHLRKGPACFCLCHECFIGISLHPQWIFPGLDLVPMVLLFLFICVVCVSLLYSRAPHQPDSPSTPVLHLFFLWPISDFPVPGVNPLIPLTCVSPPALHPLVCLVCIQVQSLRQSLSSHLFESLFDLSVTLVPASSCRTSLISSYTCFLVQWTLKASDRWSRAQSQNPAGSLKSSSQFVFESQSWTLSWLELCFWTVLLHPESAPITQP